MQGTPRWWQNGRRVKAVLADNQAAEVRLNIGLDNDFWFTDMQDNPVAVLKVNGPAYPVEPIELTTSVTTKMLPDDVLTYRQALQNRQVINRPVEFYLALADAWLLVNEQQPLFQYRIRNNYNGLRTEWNSIRQEQVIEVAKLQPENAEFRVLVPGFPELRTCADLLISEIEALKEAIGKLYPANTEVRRYARVRGLAHLYADTNAKMELANIARNTPHLDTLVKDLRYGLTPP